MVASEQVEAAPLPDPVGALLREAAGVCQGAWLLGPVIHGHVTGRAQVEGGGGTLAVGRLERSALKSVAEGLDARLDEEAGALRVLMGGDDVEVDVVDLSTLDEARGGESSGPVQGILSLLARFDVAAEAVAVGADGAVVDPFDGVADLRRRRVRTIGAARGLFREQPAAILRVASAVG